MELNINSNNQSFESYQKKDYSKLYLRIKKNEIKLWNTNWPILKRIYHFFKSIFAGVTYYHGSGVKDYLKDRKFKIIKIDEILTQERSDNLWSPPSQFDREEKNSNQSSPTIPPKKTDVPVVLDQTKKDQQNTDSFVHQFGQKHNNLKPQEVLKQVTPQKSSPQADSQKPELFTQKKHIEAEFVNPQTALYVDSNTKNLEQKSFIQTSKPETTTQPPNVPLQNSSKAQSDSNTESKANDTLNKINSFPSSPIITSKKIDVPIVLNQTKKEQSQQNTAQAVHQFGQKQIISNTNLNSQQILSQVTPQESSTQTTISQKPELITQKKQIEAEFVNPQQKDPFKELKTKLVDIKNKFFMKFLFNPNFIVGQDKGLHIGTSKSGCFFIQTTKAYFGDLINGFSISMSPDNSSVHIDGKPFQSLSKHHEEMIIEASKDPTIYKGSNIAGISKTGNVTHITIKETSPKTEQQSPLLSHDQATLHQSPISTTEPPTPQPMPPIKQKSQIENTLIQLKNYFEDINKKINEKTLNFTNLHIGSGANGFYIQDNDAFYQGPGNGLSISLSNVNSIVWVNNALLENNNLTEAHLQLIEHAKQELNKSPETIRAEKIKRDLFSISQAWKQKIENSNNDIYINYSSKGNFYIQNLAFYDPPMCTNGAPPLNISISSTGELRIDNSPFNNLTSFTNAHQVLLQIAKQEVGIIETRKSTTSAMVSTISISDIDGFKKDPYQNLFTLNCHGAFSNFEFQLPDGVYLLIPHPQGFKNSYVVDSPPQEISFEQLIAQGIQNDKFLQPSSGGWTLLKPGQKANNLSLSPWTKNEYQTWSTFFPDDVKYIEQKFGMIPSISIVPGRDDKKSIVNYNTTQSSKIKVFYRTNLKEVADTLKKKNSDKPILLVPFCCNAKQGSQQEKVTCVDYQNSLKTLIN